MRNGQGQQRGPARWLVAIVAVAAVAGSGRARERATRVNGEPLRAVATIGMIGDIAARIGGERARGESLMGPGVDPHLYKASAGDVRRLANADLVLYNGLHLEAAMGEVLEEMGRWKHTVAVTEWIDRGALSSSAAFSGNWDPHVWFDVRLWMRVTQRIEAALAEADPQHASEYATRGAAVLEELAQLDEWVRRRAADLPPERRVLIT